MSPNSKGAVLVQANTGNAANTFEAIAREWYAKYKSKCVTLQITVNGYIAFSVYLSGESLDKG
jgi:hypothetical protein